MSRLNPSYVTPRADVAALVPAGCRRVLDVGCATGALGGRLKANRTDCTVIGVESNAEMAEVAKTRLDGVLWGDVQEILQRGGLERESFDCVIAADVLEHLVDPWTILRELTRLLMPGGSVIASLPNVGHYDTVVNLLFRRRWPYRERGIHDRGHLRFFAYRNVIELFDSAGLRIERMRRQYRILERPYSINKMSRLLAVPPFRNLLTFQFLVQARKTDGRR